jgi:hypothetical protein
VTHGGCYAVPERLDGGKVAANELGERHLSLANGFAGKQRASLSSPTEVPHRLVRGVDVALHLQLGQVGSRGVHARTELNRESEGAGARRSERVDGRREVYLSLEAAIL